MLKRKHLNTPNSIRLSSLCQISYAVLVMIFIETSTKKKIPSVRYTRIYQNEVTIRRIATSLDLYKPSTVRRNLFMATLSIPEKPHLSQV